ncbi:MAG: hypothetical protein J6R26_02155 [Paludibacteraceae bacterium]|nr:hypothetical protein [Paludibacteraceae bacterium]
MYIRLIRNKAKGNAITGRLVIDGRWFCNTLERKGVEIPALCYHVCVTQSPKFKRLLPLVTGVPRTPQSGYGTATPIGRANGAMGYRQGIRIHRGSQPEHSSGCVLVVADNKNNLNNLRANQLPGALKGIGRSAADVERELTSLILKAQQEHEEIILEVSDFRAGTEYGYNNPCERELQQYEIDARRAEQRYYELHPEECKS